MTDDPHRSKQDGTLLAGCFRLVLAALLILPLATEISAATTQPDVGQAIYRSGVIGSGRPLEATNAAGTRIEGTAAACANCHRRSGLGEREGLSLVPPITGRYLYRPLGGWPDSDVGWVEGLRDMREPYTDATLARAIRAGIDVKGRPLNPLMPRFELGDADMAALIDYLKGLDPGRVPGITTGALHFATIITPDADPVKRRGMLAVLEQYVAERNARQMSPMPRVVRGRHVFMVHRRWELHVWQLQGAPSTWKEQLRQRLKAQPVFAVISGLGGRTWAPVHAFCEEEGLPCLFPNVEAPVEAEQRDFHTLYFSRGVFLEAGLIAQAIVDAGIKGPATVRQVYRAGDVGEAAADALESMLAPRGIKVTRTVLPEGAPGTSMPKVFPAAGAALVLWLRPPDLAALGEASAAPPLVYVSGLMGGLEYAPLAPAWRERTHLSYPVDLPDRRRVRLDFAWGWFRIRKVPIEDFRVQADTYLACGLLSETVNHMADTFVRDYLIERIEDMLDHRVLTGYYPRLTLATGQRFASKGGYMVRFAEAKGAKLVAKTGWVVPAIERPTANIALR